MHTTQHGGAPTPTHECNQDVELSNKEMTTQERVVTEAWLIARPSCSGRSMQQVLKKKIQNKIEQLRKL
ncbi:hypothetical protein QE152_g7952 [Popillia japonica]|uniref:Uncharacterized protein n=1 Tax=Popillia japonica TaxID=7064 RepID=A0AAW1MCH3_POPJA